MNKSLTINITAATVVKILAILGVTALVWYLRELVLILVTAIVIASAVDPAAKSLHRIKIPRVFAVVIVYILFIGLFAGIIYAFIPPLLNETSGLLTDMPSLVEMIEQSEGLGSLPAGMNLSDTAASVNQFISQFSGNMFSMVSNIFGGMFTFILILVFSFYFAVQERSIQDFIRVIIPRGNEEYAIDLWARSQKKIGLWMQGQVLLAVIIGTLTFLGLTIIGVKYALLLAVLAGVFELIPVFGPILAGIPAVLVAFVTGGPALAGIVLALYLIIQQFENHLIYPLVVTKVVGVPPLIVIISLIVGAQMAGFLGILLSVPLAAVLQEVVKDLDKWKHEKA
jgi:predicted PurR-regulated permease PerM